jgi:hypothetical protein
MELLALRGRLQDLAEATNDCDVMAQIPTSLETARGWNRLCAALANYYCHE